MAPNEDQVYKHVLYHSHLPLCVHLQNIHHIDHDIFVRFLVLPHSERHSEPAGSPSTHVAFLAVFLSPLTHLKTNQTEQGEDVRRTSV